jgi:hypothetical protein
MITMYNDYYVEIYLLVSENFSFYNKEKRRLVNYFCVYVLFFLLS